MSTTAAELNRLAYGNGMTYSEWMSHFKLHGVMDINEYKEVKQLINIDGSKYFNIKTLVVKKSRYYHMKYGSASGSSGSSQYPNVKNVSSFSLENYELTNEEVQEIINKYDMKSPILEHNVWLGIKPIVWSSGRIEQRQEICCNQDFKYLTQLLEELRILADAKFEKNAIKKMNTYYIDDTVFKYESIQMETIGDKTETPLYQFYLFNDNDICHTQLNMNSIQG